MNAPEEDAERTDDGQGNGFDGREGESGETQREEAEGDRAESSPQAMGWVYFIETEDGNFVKIGFSTTPLRRLAQLGTLMPVRLIGCFPGSRTTESWMHRKFASERTTGEWFRSSPELRQLISLIGMMEPIPVRLPKPKKIPTPKVKADQAEIWTGYEMNQAAVKLGSKGGKARARKLTPEELSEQGRKAVQTRWEKAKKAGKKKV